MQMETIALVYVMIGGAVGSLGRYLSMSFIGRIASGYFPYATLAVNIIGSFIMGVWIASMANLLPEKSKDLHLLFAVGFLGGFTTFSTFSLDIFYLFERGLYIQAGGYALASVILSVVALIFGMMLVRVFV